MIFKIISKLLGSYFYKIKDLFIKTSVSWKNIFRIEVKTKAVALTEALCNEKTNANALKVKGYHKLIESNKVKRAGILGTDLSKNNTNSNH